ncbi:MAG TPA: DMT family transporter [Chloroflexia bacterium]|nr:DMT family transporter [Chloroflexia bacterium]
MSGREFAVLFALGAIWGASFMFIKVGGAEMQPFFLVEMRLGLAALTMVLISLTDRTIWRGLREHWRPLTVMGLINCAIPYTLITWGEEHISSGLAAIYNAVTPLWAAGLGLVWAWAERLSLGRLAGLLVGLAGVVLVVSGNISQGLGGPMSLAGQGAVLVAALSYAVSGIFAKHTLSGVPLRVAATGQLLAGALMLLPFAATQIPPRVPSALALGAVTVLAVLGTSIATMMLYWLLGRVGATRTMLVTYLLPGFALMWGALFLNEAITLTAVAGLALVLLGIAITSGRGSWLVARLRPRAEVSATEGPADGSRAA